MQMRLVSGGDLKRGRLDLDEARVGEPRPESRHDAVPRHEERPAVAMAFALPEWRRTAHLQRDRGLKDMHKPLAVGGKIAKVRAELAAAGPA